MESNSEEFYKQKYLKYKHKYLEAQKLYGEELEGGVWGDWIWVICPTSKMDIIKDSWQYTGGTVTDENCLWLQLGDDSWYCTSGKKKLTNCGTGVEEKDVAFTGGLGMEKKEGKLFGTNNVYSDVIAQSQLNTYITTNNLSSTHRIFKYKSAPNAGSRKVEFTDLLAK
jgi:hypothetical protein